MWKFIIKFKLKFKQSNAIPQSYISFVFGNISVGLIVNLSKVSVQLILIAQKKEQNENSNSQN